MPGSFAEASGADNLDDVNLNPSDVCADDEYRSQKSTEEIEVSVQLIEE